MWKGLAALASGFVLVGMCWARDEVQRVPRLSLSRVGQERPPDRPSNGPITAPGKQPTQPVSHGDRTLQYFPAQGSQQDAKTGWDIEWDLAPNPNKKVHLLRILSARFFFKDGTGTLRSIVVARNLELAETFAPYDDKRTAFLDLYLPNRANRDVVATPKLLGPNCVAPGEILRWSKNPNLSIFREVHDDGIRWLKGYGKTGFGENEGHRGQKLVLCSLFQAVNYLYLVQYEFTDDGRIVCKLGFTGHNFFHRGKNLKVPADAEGDVHLHVGCWRMDFDLGDPAQNEYLLVRRYFDASANRFRVGAALFNDGREGKAKWKAEEFTVLRVVSGKERSRGGKWAVAYDLISSRLGSVRDLPATGDVKNFNTDFVNYDFWITQAPKSDVAFHNLPTLAAGQRPLKGKPATVWYSTSGLHVPRGEDFGLDGITKEKGVALTTWIEFTLRPRELFDATPFYR